MGDGNGGMCCDFCFACWVVKGDGTVESVCVD